MILRAVAATALCIALFAVAPARAAVLFADDFESTLSSWVGKFGGAHNGAIVVDALNASNHALKFNALNSAGDVFATAGGFNVGAGATLWLTFDYRGVPGQGVPGDTGGFAGYSDDLPGNHVWLAGTQDSYGGLAQYLIDDGAWHSYVIQFNSAYSSIHLMLEDFGGSFGVPGDALFDNIRLLNSAPGAVPLPGSLLLAAFGLFGLLASRRRSR